MPAKNQFDNNVLSSNKMTVKCFLLCHYIHQKLKLVENVNIIHK